MEVSDAAKLRAVTDMNATLKRLLADMMLDNVVLKDLLAKN
jgi:putative transposase